MPVTPQKLSTCTINYDANYIYNFFFYSILHCIFYNIATALLFTGMPIIIINTTPVLSTCRPSIITYGMWDQLRVDMGREFCLMLFIQDMLKECRNNTSRLPYIQSTSKEVSIINLGIVSISL